MGLKPDYHYVAYIDEAGDDGLRTVKPIDKNGSSEWCVLSAVLMRAEHEEADVDAWVSQLTKLGVSRQQIELHFRKLNTNRKKAVCTGLTQYPVRAFVICSNKKNMRGHKNPLAEAIPSKNWF